LGGAHAPAPVADALAATGGDVDAQRAGRRDFMAKPVDQAVLERLTTIGRNVRRDVTEQLVTAWNEGVPEGRSQSAFAGPVLLARGTADTLVTSQMFTDVAARFKNCSRVELKGCGHWPLAEHPELVAETVLKFIASVSDKAATGKGADGWTKAFDDRAEGSFEEVFAASVVFEASAMARRVEGRERVKTIMGMASRQYSALKFTRRTVDGDRTYLEWEATIVGGVDVNGITILTTDTSGKIISVAIHHRPLTALLHFSSRLGGDLAGKVEPGLFYDSHSTQPA
ncbi:MAG TPA: alpha/beta hydrolase, partial [Steroidobacteraceae bacterium]